MSAGQRGPLESAIVGSTSALVLVVDPAARVTYANPAAYMALAAFGSVLNADAADIIAASGDADALRRVMLATQLGGPSATHEVQMPATCGAPSRVVTWTVSALAGHPGYVVCVGSDTSRLRAECENLRATAARYALTGLPNRAGLIEHLKTSAAGLHSARLVIPDASTSGPRQGSGSDTKSPRTLACAPAPIVTLGS